MTGPMYMGKKMCPEWLRGSSFSRQSTFRPRKQGQNVPGKLTGKRVLPRELLGNRLENESILPILSTMSTSLEGALP